MKLASTPLKTNTLGPPFRRAERAEKEQSDDMFVLRWMYNESVVDLIKCLIFAPGRGGALMYQLNKSVSADAFKITALRKSPIMRAPCRPPPTPHHH